MATTATVPADDAGIARAAAMLRAGGIVALPTETVYGLAARADSSEAVAAIYRAKGRPSFNPLIVHVGTMAQARAIALFDDRAERLAGMFWPGPLTLVLPLKKGARIAAAISAGLPTVALRMPAHPAMAAILEATLCPLAAPSANRSGALSPTTAAHVLASLGGRIRLICDGGTCSAGLESTIVALRNIGWSYLRPGPILQEELAEVLGDPTETQAGSVEAPGQLSSHYSPGKPLRLDAETASDSEFLIGFGSIAGDISLSARGDLAEAAARLYEVLHQASAADMPNIAVAPIPGTGIGQAINDRLKRAAS